MKTLKEIQKLVEKGEIFNALHPLICLMSRDDRIELSRYAVGLVCDFYNVDYSTLTFRNNAQAAIDAMLKAHDDGNVKDYNIAFIATTAAYALTEEDNQGETDAVVSSARTIAAEYFSSGDEFTRKIVSTGLKIMMKRKHTTKEEMK